MKYRSLYMECTRQTIQRISLQRSDEARANFFAEVSMLVLYGLMRVAVIAITAYKNVATVFEV